MKSAFLPLPVSPEFLKRLEADARRAGVSLEEHVREAVSGFGCAPEEAVESFLNDAAREGLDWEFR